MGRAQLISALPFRFFYIAVHCSILSFMQNVQVGDNVCSISVPCQDSI